MVDKKHWMADAFKNRGALHRELGVAEGKKIPAKKLARAAKSRNPTERKRAVLARTGARISRRGGSSR